MAEFRAGTPEQAAFLAELVDARAADRVPASRASTAAAADVRGGAAGVRRGSSRDAARPRRPSSCASRRCCPRAQLETSGYLASFPHLAGSVFAFDGDERGAASRSSARRATRTGASSRR